MVDIERVAGVIEEVTGRKVTTSHENGVRCVTAHYEDDSHITGIALESIKDSIPRHKLLIEFGEDSGLHFVFEEQ